MNGSDKHYKLIYDKVLIGLTLGACTGLFKKQYIGFVAVCHWNYPIRVEVTVSYKPTTELITGVKSFMELVSALSIAIEHETDYASLYTCKHLRYCNDISGFFTTWYQWQYHGILSE